MGTRRDFLTQSALASAAIVASPLASFAGTGKEKITEQPTPLLDTGKDGLFPAKFGLGGVAIGNGWHPNANEQITETLNTAWNAGVRYYDTSPFYGFGLSERRLGHFLSQKPREEFVISTKVGRIFEADRHFFDTYKNDGPDTLWKNPSPFKYKYDYTAAGVRRSIEDSLERLGIPSLDFVLIHDLSPDNSELGKNWTEEFEIAQKGAFPELTKMREEGLIKGWGLGVNSPQPILKALEVADPNIMLVAIQYTLFVHKIALNDIMPALDKRGIKAIIGGPLNGGFAAGLNRWNYGATIGADMPKDAYEKRDKISAIAKRYNLDVRTVALQFSASNPATGAVIPGASRPEQVTANVKSFTAKIPADLWSALKAAKLIEGNAPV